MKTKSVRLIIWSVIAVILLALMIALYLRPSLMSRFSINIPGVPGITGISYDNASKYKVGSGSVDGRISSLNIDWVDGDVTVELYDGNEVSFEESSTVNLRENEQLHWYNDNGSLILKYCASGASTRNNLDKTLTVKLPKNSSLDELDINAVSATINVSGVEVDELNIDGVSGEVVLNELYGRKLNIDGVSGRVVLSGLYGSELDIDTVSGAVNAQDVDYARFDVTTVSGEICLAMAENAKPESIDMDTTSGAMELLLSEKQGFTAELGSVSGDISSDFEVVMTGKDALSRGDGSLEINANSVSGALKIEKLK